MRVRVSGIPAGLVRSGAVELPDGATVGQLLARLEREEAGSGGALGPETLGPYAVFLNGRNVASLDGMETLLGDSDEVLVVTPAAGG